MIHLIISINVLILKINTFGLSTRVTQAVQTHGRWDRAVNAGCPPRRSEAEGLAAEPPQPAGPWAGTGASCGSALLELLLPALSPIPAAGDEPHPGEGPWGIVPACPGFSSLFPPSAADGFGFNSSLLWCSLSWLILFGNRNVLIEISHI